MKVSIIIPCYNEEKGIEKTIENIPKEGYEIIAVDNNSTDKTAEIAKKLGARVVFEKNRGYGYALKKGIKEAKGEIIVTLDGDGQYPASEIPKILNFMKENNLDFVNCARFPLKNKKSLNFTRILGNYFLTFLANLLFGLRLKDSQSGMMVFKKEIFKKISLESNDMPISEELKIKTILSGFKFSEYHIDYFPREGESKLFPLKHGLQNTLFLFESKWKTFSNFSKNVFKILPLIPILIIYFYLTSIHINRPFISVTSDVNGDNGYAAWNWLKYSPLKLKFGNFPRYIDHLENTYGNFYTHHPSFYLFTTYIFYKIFGINEITTRLGPIFMFTLGLIFFYFALVKIFKNYFYAFLISLILTILPGFVYYGETFELAVFSLPTALITFSLFVFYFYERRNIYKWLFYLSIIFGGLMGWFYYFLPASIWLYVLFNKNDFRKEFWEFIIIIPLLLIILFSFNIFHFYILNGEKIFDNLKQAFLYRTQRQPFIFWWQRIFWLLKLHLTWVFVILGGLGILLFFKDFKKFKIFLPLLLMPFFVFAVFYQWSTHPFGVIFVHPFIAFTSGLVLIYLKEKLKILSIFLGLIVIVLGFYFSLKNLSFFFNQFLILGVRDVAFAKEIKNFVNNGDICLGRNQMGLGFTGIFTWYLDKKVLESPDCLNQSKLALLFHPQLGEFYQKEAELFINNGYKIEGCLDLLCVFTKE